MAALTSTGVSRLSERYSGGGLFSKRYVTRKFTLTLTGQGTAANPIPVSVLGFSKIINAKAGIVSDNSLIIVAVPNYAGTVLLLKAAGSNAPADYTHTMDIEVEGIPV